MLGVAGKLSQHRWRKASSTQRGCSSPHPPRRPIWGVPGPPSPSPLLPTSPLAMPPLAVEGAAIFHPCLYDRMQPRTILRKHFLCLVALQKSPRLVFALVCLTLCPRANCVQPPTNEWILHSIWGEGAQCVASCRPGARVQEVGIRCHCCTQGHLNLPGSRQEVRCCIEEHPASRTS